MNKAEVQTAFLHLMNCINHDSCDHVDCVYFNSLKDMETVKEFIKEAEVIIRCKECRYYSQDNVGNEGWCYFMETDVNDDDFCSKGRYYGEKEE